MRLSGLSGEPGFVNAALTSTKAIPSTPITAKNRHGNFDGVGAITSCCTAEAAFDADADADAEPPDCAALP